MSEHRDVRVRAGPPGARSAAESGQPDVGSTVMPGANGFGYFCRNKSSPRRGTARKKDMDVEAKTLDAGKRAIHGQELRRLHDEQKKAPGGRSQRHPELIGYRRSRPNAQVDTRGPGAAWRRLNSLASTMRTTRCTVSASKPEAMISACDCAPSM